MNSSFFGCACKFILVIYFNPMPENSIYNKKLQFK